MVSASECPISIYSGTVRNWLIWTHVLNSTFTVWNNFSFQTLKNENKKLYRKKNWIKKNKKNGKKLKNSRDFKQKNEKGTHVSFRSFRPRNSVKFPAYPRTQKVYLRLILMDGDCHMGLSNRVIISTTHLWSSIYAIWV